MSRNKITKNTVPEGFSVPLAIADFVPVIFFGLSAIKAGGLLHSALFIAGAAICLVSGVVKASWKLIAAARGKNVWPMFLQMRILMPAGLLMLIFALAVNRTHLNGAAILAGATAFPACIFFALGAIGMALMCVFAFRLDSSAPKSNWIEQITNSMAQICFFVGLMLV